MTSRVDALPVPARRTLPEADLMRRFQQVVADAPDRPAIRWAAGELSFAGLYERVTHLAGALHRRGVGPGARVGVCLPRHPDLLVTLLAVWLAGAAYVPLDPAYPAERLRFMADDAGVALVVAPAEADAAWSTGRTVIALDSLSAEHGGAVEPDLPCPSLRPAYVIYTSGSTGRPKGVEASQGGVAHLLRGLEDAGIYAADPRTVAWNASVSFDASIQQWVRICRGDTIVLLDEDLRSAPEAMATYLSAAGVTDLDLTPSHWEVLSEQLTPRTAPAVPLRIFLGGEAVPPAMWRSLTDAAGGGLIEAVNLYGPTECTVDATAGWVNGPGPHVGRPLAGVRAYVLDERLRPVVAGDEGELYLAGDGVANGYANRPGLTAERFVADASGPAGSRMYRTGDRGRLRADGVLEYTGRMDRQVKVHGYRIEPGEIEAVLGGHEHVSAVVVRVHTDDRLGPVLVAYYTHAGPAEVPVQALRDRIAAQLPEFMVPSVFVAMSAMPRTTSGKIDVAALPEPVLGGADDPSDGAAPAGPLEELIARTWADVLGQDSVSATDDFFALGGHSLVALRVVAQLKKQLGVVVPTKLVYEYPRLRDLAARVDALRA